MPCYVKTKDSKRKSKPSPLDYSASRVYYGVVQRGKLVEYEPGNPIIYKLDEEEELRRDYPRAKVVKIRMTLEVIAEVIL